MWDVHKCSTKKNRGELNCYNRKCGKCFSVFVFALTELFYANLNQSSLTINLHKQHLKCSKKTAARGLLTPTSLYSLSALSLTCQFFHWVCSGPFVRVSGRPFSLIRGLGCESKAGGELLFSIRQSGTSQLNRIERGPLGHRRAVMLCVAGMTAMPRSNPIKEHCV